MVPEPSPPAHGIDRSGRFGRTRRSGPIAFVLSGGGNLGALQLGMLRALLEHDVRPDFVVGCSVGAINGAGFADAPTLEGIDGMETMWLELDKHNLLPSGWANAVALARRGEAIHDLAGLRGMAEERLRATTFEELAVHFECVATDVAGAREVWFDSGPLVEPILASSALPAIYPAVEIDGVRYLDGGIVNDVPISRAVELGARTIYILQVGSFMRTRREPKRPLDVVVQAYWVARHHRFKRELDALPPDVDVHVLPTGETPRMRFNDFTHSATLIARAHEAATEYLDELAAGRRPPSPVERLPAAVMAPIPAVPPEPLEAPAPSEPSLPAEPSVPVGAGAGVLSRRLNGNGKRTHRNGNGRWRGNGHATSAPNGPEPPDDAEPIDEAEDADGMDGVDGADRLAGVRRWARATRLRRLTDRPLRRTPAAVTQDPVPD
jgi:NTE family protein